MRQKRRNSTWVLIALFIIVVAFGWFYWRNINSPVDPTGELKAFVIQKGESTDQIAKRLKEEGFIRSPVAFKFYLRSSGKAGKIQAGTFKLSSAMNFDEIMKNLSSGMVDKWVTLIEGWRVEEMAERLYKELGISKEEFIAEAEEGYMFPDSYLFNKDATAADVVSVLKNTFNQRYGEELQVKVKSLGLTPEQGVILASIVEREARTDEVRTRVASILLRRLKIEMGLNTDATIQYALGYQQGEKSWWKRNLTLDDLKIRSPYNTYIHRGLPPTPICNPSLSSLNAVANADVSTPYLYYFHDSKGNTYYGRTLDEHNENVARYR